MDMKTATIIDYAWPLMQIEKLAREVHDLANEKQFDKAIDKALLLGVEAKVLTHVLTIMRDAANR